MGQRRGFRWAQANLEGFGAEVFRGAQANLGELGAEVVQRSSGKLRGVWSRGSESVRNNRRSSQETQRRGSRWGQAPYYACGWKKV